MYKYIAKWGPYTGEVHELHNSPEENTVSQIILEHITNVKL